MLVSLPRVALAGDVNNKSSSTAHKFKVVTQDADGPLTTVCHSVT